MAQRKKRRYSKNAAAKKAVRETERVLGRGLSRGSLAVIMLFAALILFGAYLEEQSVQKDEPAVVVSSFIEKDADLIVKYIDVGQGDCELISYGGRSVLIDSGEKDAEDAVFEAIDGLGIKKLDYIIATHPHSDHIGCMDKVIKNYEVGTVIVPQISDDMIPTSNTYERFLNALSYKGIRLTAAKCGDVYSLEAFEGDNTAFEVLAPAGDGYDDLNDWSVVIRLVHGNSSFIFTGDAEAVSESDILSLGKNISSDVLKVGHHGSSSSTSDEFLEAVSPKIAVISCGEGNSYGHPHKEIKKKLNENNIECYRTDENGTITAYCDGESIKIICEKEAASKNADN